jgi:hypothetical protein
MFYSFANKDSSILVANTVGALAGLYCFTTYQQFCNKFLTGHWLFCFAMTVVSMYWLAIGNIAILGIVGAIMATLKMIAPLVSLRRVIRDKSTEALPFLLCSVYFGNALSWTAYGKFALNDPFVSLSHQ